MDTNALNRLIKRLGRGHVLVCAECGNPDVQETAWVHANFRTYAGDHENGLHDSGNHRCPDCDRRGGDGNVEFCSLEEFEKRMDADVAALDPSVPSSVTIRKNWENSSYLAKRKIWLTLRGASENAAPAPKPAKNRLESIREDALTEIRAFLQRYDLTELDACDVEDGSSPVIQQDPYDDNDTYTLDGISIRDGRHVVLKGSSCFRNLEWDSECIEIPTDVLVSVAEWLSDNEDTFAEGVIRDIFKNSDVDEAADELAQFADVERGDEKIDDGLDGNEDGDKYLMMRSYDVNFGDVKFAHVRTYFGDVSRKVSCLDVNFD